MHVPFGTVSVTVVCPLFLPAPAELCYFHHSLVSVASRDEKTKRKKLSFDNIVP